MIFNIFGSQDSLDYDVMFFCENITSTQKSKKIATDLEKNFIFNGKSILFNDKPLLCSNHETLKFFSVEPF
jgi:hypothetical protein